MSLIGVRVKDNYISLVADSQITMGWVKESRIGFKTFMTQNAVVGYAGTALFKPFVEKAVRETKIVEHNDETIFKIIDKIHDESALRGFKFTDEESSNGTLILATKNKVTIINGYSFSEVKTHAAIGAGADTVNTMLKHLDISLFDAVRFAAESSIYCDGPFELFVINRETGEVFYDVRDEAGEYLTESEIAYIDYSEYEESEDGDGTYFDSTPDFNLIIKNINPERVDDELTFPTETV